MTAPRDVPEVDVEAFEGHTPGPWQAFRVTNEQDEPLRGTEAAEYVADCIAKRPDADFYAVAQLGEGTPDICHTGNGPTSAINARLIAAAPALLVEVRRLREENLDLAHEWAQWFEKWKHTLDREARTIERLAKAEATAAEMRKALETAESLLHHVSANTGEDQLHCRRTIAAWKVLNAVLDALSRDAGRWEP